MRVLMIVVACIACGAAPSLAQPSDRGYVNFGGGVAISSDTTSGNILGEAGVRVARNLFVFGDLGQFHNLQPSLVQPTVDATTLALASDGVTVTGTGRVPALQVLGGVRYLIPTHGGATPYVLGGAGLARLMPTAEFTYTSGTITGATPTPGDDVTAQLISNGDFTAPPATNAFMFTFGGGVQVPIAPHVDVDVGYRLSRINGDTPVNAQSIMAGVGYRF
ncbi:MAG TPA: outer membrane beta-barrel protein [Vicinamibacterales bacterium]|nr:outer membrane beta-barrel protein [Vicinamibacterales bacterium]